MVTITDILVLSIYFLVYAFFGWILEVIYHAVEKGRVVNRGFLNGPLCPIYGSGMVLMIVVMTGVSQGLGTESLHTPILFVVGMILCSLIELFGGWALDRMFHTRWWDYSEEPFNIGGYICLRFSLAWGIAVVFAMKIIHPVVRTFTFLVASLHVGWILTGIAYLFFLADLVLTVSVIIGLNRRIREIDDMRVEMRRFSNDLTVRVADRALETKGRLEEAKVEAEESREEYTRELQKRRELLEAKMSVLQHRLDSSLSVEHRLFQAFPTLNKPDHRELMEDLKAYSLRRHKEKA